MKKSTLRIEQQQPRNIQRADIAPEVGYSMVVLADRPFAEGGTMAIGDISAIEGKAEVPGTGVHFRNSPAGARIMLGAVIPRTVRASLEGDMRRRAFIAGISATTTWPVLARAQQTANSAARRCPTARFSRRSFRPFDGGCAKPEWSRTGTVTRRRFAGPC
jgi:hypothetical protein